MNDLESGQMSVAAWSKDKPAAGSHDFIPPPAPDLNDSAAPAAAAEEPAPGSSLPLDPWRLAGGLWKRRSWMLIALAAGLTLGLAAGLLRAKTRYQASVQLIKRELPSAFRVGEIGEAFHPHQLSNGTLVGAAAAPIVLDRVAAKAKPAVSANELRGEIEVKEQKNTEFVFLTLSGFHSATGTAETANLWAEEVVQFTRELQSQESREMRIFLQQRVNATDTDLRKLNEQILDFSKRENLVDADKQIDAYLRSAADMDLKYETARIDLETVDFKIQGIEAELRRQSPLADKLREEQGALEELRARYTDENPLVIDKLDRIRTLTEAVAKAAKGEQGAASSYAGTPLGNTLYLELIQRQNEKLGLQRQKEELEKLRDQERAKLSTIPEKVAAFAQFSMKRQSLSTARNLLFSRLGEAQLFEENSPGYYRIFAPATTDSVLAKGKLTKTLIYAAAAAVLFTLAAFAAALVAELLDPKLRTTWEGAKAFSAPVLAAFPKEDADVALAAELWSHWIGSSGHATLPRVLWSPDPGPEEEIVWAFLLERAAALLPSVRVIDCGRPGLAIPSSARVRIEPVDTTLFSIGDARQLGNQLRDACRRGSDVWIRITGTAHEPMASIARAGLAPLVIVRLNAADTSFWKGQGELMEKTIGKAAGVVTLGEIPILQWK